MENEEKNRALLLVEQSRRQKIMHSFELQNYQENFQKNWAGKDSSENSAAQNKSVSDFRVSKISARKFGSENPELKIQIRNSENRKNPHLKSQIQYNSGRLNFRVRSYTSHND